MKNLYDLIVKIDLKMKNILLNLSKARGYKK